MKILRISGVCAKVGLARATVYKMMSDGRFPVARQLGARAVGWDEAEVDDWLAAAPRAQQPGA